MSTPIHSFHIPVMGLAYTIDSPFKVARFGINSVLSIVEDRLIESMRNYYYQQANEPYVPITANEKDYRARRITDYLNLMNRTVQAQVEALKNAAFEAGSELVKYVDMLPDSSTLKSLYQNMIQSNDVSEKARLEQMLRSQIQPGSIDVNIMTKVDKNNLDRNGLVRENGSDALTALQGYANSTLSNSSIIFSAGLNPRLFNYLENCPEFDAKGLGEFDKKVVIKVSDYRSALIQGKYLAKKGVWVSEFRVESGLNCGGHAFATDGYLMGPILEEFKQKKTELVDALFSLYVNALQQKGKPVFTEPHPIKLTVQGGIGTHQEDQFLHQYYGAESTGWGTPFLLVPEATTVDDDTLEKLQKARQKDVVLSKASPLGVRFYYLKGTSAEVEKLNRINRGRPGSPCTEKHLVTNTEFTKEPICTASQQYQKLKLEQLNSLNLPAPEYNKQVSELEEKECLCVGLSNAVSHVYGVPFLKKLHAVTICPGPNIAYFSKVASLKEMTDHIYGRTNLLDDPDRPHMFLNELTQYLNYLEEQLADADPTDSKRQTYLRNFGRNLDEGIAYYRQLTPSLFDRSVAENAFSAGLAQAHERLQTLAPELLAV
ncbi:hypothetical protein EXU85_30250 [Spirosoma sp. KCTC 42546]|uniref:hypothetical protein n=1 Tax=Spirosoma sp. KCTC 42546 TaxID=2520506 RepID=UPI001157C102|nr:hypothetical protein [Spirosoma sp. KCTC 42546]QDK82660.1 hypothetical protein EXU85_30250 [Spirosoma sp. KCTC 42546]